MSVPTAGHARQSGSWAGRARLGPMDNAKRRRIWRLPLATACYALIWFQFGLLVAIKMFLGTLLGILVFFVVPVWLAAVYGKPYSERRR